MFLFLTTVLLCVGMLIQRHTLLRILLDDDEYDKGEG